MSDVIEHRMHYIPFRIQYTDASREMLHKLATKQIVVMDETVMKQLCGMGTAQDYSSLSDGIGHSVIMKDPTAPEGRYLFDCDTPYPDASSVSCKNLDTISEIIGHVSTLRSLVRMTSGELMDVVVVDDDNTTIMQQLREEGWAGSTNELKWEEVIEGR